MTEIDCNILFNKKPFNNMDINKLKQIEKIYNQLQNSNTIDPFRLIQEFNQILSGEDPLTPSEFNEIISAIREMLPTDETKKFDSMVSIIKNFVN